MSTRTTADSPWGAPAAILPVMGSRAADQSVDADDVHDEVAALLTVLDELVRAQLPALAPPPDPTADLVGALSASLPEHLSATLAKVLTGQRRGDEVVPTPRVASAPGAAAGSAPGGAGGAAPGAAPPVVDAAVRRRLEGGWHVLGRRRWPASHRRDLDLLLAGPGGVFVVRAVGWAHLRGSGGHLWRGHECADIVLDAVSADTDAVRRVVAEAGLAAGEVRPLVLATGSDPQPGVVRGVAVVGVPRLASFLVRQGARLEPPAVQAIVEVLRRACPALPRPFDSFTDDGLPRLGVAALAPLAPTENDRVMRALDDVLAAPAVPTWATWLHPEQARAVVRPLPGPALLTGPAGTGKTLVALHRVRTLAGSGRRVLITSPVPGIAEADRVLARRMAPATWDDVEVMGLVAVARRLLAEAGDPRTGRIDTEAAHECWQRVWAGRGLVHEPDWLGQDFWREEVAEVVGRGFADADDHARWCSRRAVPLPEVVRRDVWTLAEEYRRRLEERGVLDAEQAFRLAHARLTLPHRPLWDCVVVDEAQEASWAGWRLIAALGATRTDGLLIVADADRAGRREPIGLGESGLDLGDRVLALRQDHRSAERVLVAAADLLGEGFQTRRPVATAHPRRAGGHVVQVVARSASEEEELLVRALTAGRQRSGGRPDQAVLVDRPADVAHWLAVLTAAGVPVSLPGAAGRGDGAVRVALIDRVRGAEAAQVYLPRWADDRDLIGAVSEAERPLADSVRDQQRRRLHLAAGRARDMLWVCRPA